MIDGQKSKKKKKASATGSAMQNNFFFLYISSKDTIAVCTFKIALDAPVLPSSEVPRELRESTEGSTGVRREILIILCCTTDEKRER